MQNNTLKRYWFKRRRYGWGWIPVTWQGWLTLIVGLGAIVIRAILIAKTPANADTVQFTVAVFLIVIFYFIISLLKGPKPKWRWGKLPTDNPDEDF
jgi:drug/metabolite transporter (DMT)-like permease